MRGEYWWRRRAEPDDRSSGVRLWVPWLILLLLGLGSLIVAGLLQHFANARHEVHFSHLASAEIARLMYTSQTAFRPVQHLATVFEVEGGEVSPNSFHSLARSIPLAQEHMLLALQWRPQARDAAGNVHYPIRYSYSPSPTRDADGVTGQRAPLLQQWLAQAARQRHLVLSPWYRAAGQLRVQAARPVFAGESRNGGNLRGFVVGVYWLDPLLISAWASDDPELIELWVSAAGPPGALHYTEDTVTYRERPPPPSAETLQWEENIQVFGADWTVRAVAKPDVFVASPWPSLVIALGGLTLGGVLAFYLNGLQTRERRVRELVARRTEELHRREQEFETLAERHPDMIARVDRQLCYRYVNTAMAHFVGQPREAFVGKTIGAMGLPADAALRLRRSAQAVFQTGQQQRTEQRLVTTLGERHLEAQLFPEFDPKGRVNTVLLVARDITEQKLIQITLEHLTVHDPLTGVANRRYLDQFIDREWRREARHRHTVALLMIDIDDFKAYNDHYGHQRGDTCLRQVAQALQQSLLRPGDTLVRYGGEEFAVVLPETGLKSARQLGERLRRAVANLSLPHPASSVADKVTVSIGVAATKAHEDEFSALMRQADIALYRAKEKGRNRVETAGPARG